jgi:hypothetical protein
MIIRFRIRRCSWPPCHRIAPFSYVLEPEHVRVGCACRRHRLEVQAMLQLGLLRHDSARWN